MSMATKYAWGSQPTSSANRVIQVKTTEGIILSLCKSDIVNEQVDAIVSPSGCDLQLNRGSISGALLRSGGRTLLDECSSKAPSGIHLGDLVVTSGGQLQCKFVIHGACCSWADGPDNCKQILRTLMVNSFQAAHNKNLTSVAFPAIGTGQRKKIPPHLVAAIMLDEFQKFSRLNRHTKLRDIRVVYPNIDQILWAFEEVLLTRSAGLLDASQKSGGSAGANNVEVMAGSGAVKTKEGIVIALCKSELAHQQVDAIMHTPGRQLNLKNGPVSKSLLQIGGPTLQRECARSAPNGIKFGEVILTSGGNLQCQCVIHGACSTWNDGEDTCKEVLRSLMANTLLEAHSKNLTSVAFPAIGTGHRNFPPHVVAAIMLEEVIKFSHLNPGTPLKDIRFVVHPKAHLIIKAFSEVLLNDSSTRDIIVKTREGIVLSLHKTTIADEQVDVLVHTPGRKLRLKHGALSSSLLKIAGKSLQDECDQIAPEGIQYGEIVVTSGGRLQCQEVVHGACCDWIEGAEKCKEVLRNLMSNTFMEAHSKNFSSVAFPSMGTGQRNFPPHFVATIMLEELLKFSRLYPQTSLRDVRFVVYPKDFETVQAFEELLLSCCSGLQEMFHAHPVTPDEVASRKAVEGNLQLPSNWTPMTSSDYVKLVDLAPSSSEYREVTTLMMSTAAGNVKRIHKIERIQNPSLYLKYLVHKESVMKRCGESATIERSLWHGTSADTVSGINTDGFNRSYCGKNGTAYGQGVYFATNSNYSCGYARPSGDGKKQMYLVLVLTGDYTTGSSAYRVTPDNPARPGFKFDSVVDDVSNPQMFVIFLDNQAYPKYLITFD